MAEVCPAARLDPGADWYLNQTRLFVPRGLVVHTTQGRNSLPLLKSRHHVSPGTVQYHIRAGALTCIYPDNVRCSHAAGANYAMTGVELEEYTGEPLAAENAVALARLADWHSVRWGWDRTAYFTGDPRVWIDQSWYRGAVAHRGVDYPPDRSLLHYDEIRLDEWPPVVRPHPPIEEVIDVDPVYTLDRQTFYQWNYDKKDWETVGISPNFPYLVLTEEQYRARQTAKSPGGK